MPSQSHRRLPVYAAAGGVLLSWIWLHAYGAGLVEVVGAAVVGGLGYAVTRWLLVPQLLRAGEENRRRVAEQYADWRAFAAARGGRVSSRSEEAFGVAFEVPSAVTFAGPAGVETRLEHFSASRLTDVVSTRLTFPLRWVGTFRLELSPRVLPPGAPMVRSPGDAVRLGWEPFDDRFVVTANDDDRARNLLGRDLQETLVSLGEWLSGLEGRPGYWSLHLTIDEHGLRLWVGRMLVKLDHLEQFYSAAATVFERLREPATPSHP